MDSSDYALNVFRGHVERASLVGNMNGKIVLELGPGDSIATALIAHAYGATAILVDAGRYADADVQRYQSLVESLRSQEVELNVPDISSCRNIDDVVAICGAKYLTEGVKSLRSIESDSVDFVFSQAVLEHVRRAEFPETLRECRRIVRAEGVGSHRVDLKDHLGGELNNLRFGERIWESNTFARSGFYTNRIQYSQMISLFEDAGFSVEVDDVRRWDELPTKRKALAKPFRDIPDDELRVSGFSVLLR